MFRLQIFVATIGFAMCQQNILKIANMRMASFRLIGKQKKQLGNVLQTLKVQSDSECIQYCLDVSRCNAVNSACSNGFEKNCELIQKTESYNVLSTHSEWKAYVSTNDALQMRQRIHSTENRGWTYPELRVNPEVFVPLDVVYFDKYSPYLIGNDTAGNIYATMVSGKMVFDQIARKTVIESINSSNTFSTIIGDFRNSAIGEPIGKEYSVSIRVKPNLTAIIPRTKFLYSRKFPESGLVFGYILEREELYLDLKSLVGQWSYRVIYTCEIMRLFGWTHFLVTFSDNDRTLNLYVNGTKVGKYKSRRTPISVSGQSWLLRMNQFGRFSSFAFWDRKLSKKEIKLFSET